MAKRISVALFLFASYSSILVQARAAAMSSKQSEGQSQNQAEAGQVWSSNLGFEPVGPGDLIYIAVTGSPDLSRSSRVTEEGKLMLPLMHDGVTVAGLTPVKIGEAVTSALIREKILTDPIVSVAVLEYRSRRISVVGAVRMPANFQAVGEMRLLDAIARAQGFTLDAGPEIIISKGDGQGSNTPVHIPIKALLAAKDAELNILLHGGEEIRVPEAPKLFIVGNVKVPGSYPLTDIDGSSVLKALAVSQGVLPFTAKRAYVYRLPATSNKREEISIELREILHRKAPDFPLQANDILYIPDNARKRLTATAVEHIAGFGSSVGTGLLVWH